ncbi:rdx, partial [Symbiodinium pilosum]
LSGDWSVIVEDQEFLVWSSLLAAWSDTFAAMASHDCLERASQRLTVKDFSAPAVERALEFMYTGECDAEDELLVEVTAFADKY